MLTATASLQKLQQGQGCTDPLLLDTLGSGIWGSPQFETVAWD